MYKKVSIGAAVLLIIAGVGVIALGGSDESSAPQESVDSPLVETAEESQEANEEVTEETESVQGVSTQSSSTTPSAATNNTPQTSSPTAQSTEPIQTNDGGQAASEEEETASDTPTTRGDVPNDTISIEPIEIDVDDNSGGDTISNTGGGRSL